MLIQRIVVAAILIPSALLAVYIGGLPFAIFIAIFLAAASLEFTQLLKKCGYDPGVLLSLLGVIVLAGARYFFQFDHSGIILTAVILCSSAYHLIEFEKNPETNPGNLGSSLSVILYIGWLGSYILSIRSLENGFWWLLLVLPVVWIADSAAFLIGSWFGTHPLSPNTSPNKTWEGYFASGLSGILSGGGLIWLYSLLTNQALPYQYKEGFLIGFIISITIPIGDLVESMIKRQAQTKDSGNIFPGHGGVFDRLDSLFWAAPISYYLIYYLTLH
jgi:phosphatidate cytidylyltransferase